MREDGFHEFRLSKLALACHDIALNELCHFCTYHVSTKQFAGFLVEHSFDETFRLTKRDRLAIPDERELADFDLVACLLRLGLCQANGSNLRVAICASRNIPCLKCMGVLTRNFFDADNPFMAGFVREPRRPCQVADCVETLNIGLPEAVHLNMSTVNFYAELFEA